MAAAYARAVKRVNEVNESVLAELIERDVQQLTERALDQGVTAYLQQPIHRVKPNERFLQTTIRNVAGSNRREQEARMWEAHRSHRRLTSPQLNRHQLHGQLLPEQPDHMLRLSPSEDRLRSSECERFGAAESPEGSSGRSSHSCRGACERPSSREHVREEVTGMGEHEVAAMLGSRRVKGRGAVGSRSDEPGPYLPRSQVTSGWHDEYRDQDTASLKRPLGPLIPEWLRQRSVAAHESDEAAVIDAVEIVRNARRSKGKSKPKSKSIERSKHKSKRRKKERAKAL